MENKQPPVKVGDKVDVKIEFIGSSGDALAKIDGYVIFVKDPLEVSDECKIEITKVTNRVGFAQLVNENGQTTSQKKDN